jgi:hypothetical protein
MPVVDEKAMNEDHYFHTVEVMSVFSMGLRPNSGLFSQPSQYRSRFFLPSLAKTEPD